MRGGLRALMAAGGALALVAGCTPGGDEPAPPACGDGTGAAAGPAAGDCDGSPADYGEGPYVREGEFGAKGFAAEVAVHHVERWEDRSVLRFTMRTLEESEDSYVFHMGAFSAGLTGDDWAFSLVDPVGRTHYAPLLNADEDSVGSPMPNAWVPGADYEIEVHFPPLPDTAERVSVHAVSTVGDFTGIPVIDGEPPADPPSDSSAHGDIEPGDTVRMSLRDTEIAGDPQDRVHDLYSVTDHPERSRSAGPDESTVALHADVLFDLDEAELTDEALAVLRDVAEETRAQADPSRPPISVIGHTDGQGSDEHNQDLSERRAEAVREALAEELGTDYEYETEGRGATEPVAEESGDDIEEARAANRRVEVSYRLLPEAERAPGGESGEASASGQDPAAAAAPPAPFRDGDGEIVATGSATFLSDSAGYDLNVYPMYRDGAFLVGVFELVHDGGDGSVPPVVSPLAAPEHRGGELTRFSVSEPGDDVNLRGVRVGPAPASETDEAAFVGARHYSPFPVGGESQRLFVYFPAPAGDVAEIDLDAGPFGEFPAVPVA